MRRLWFGAALGLAVIGLTACGGAGGSGERAVVAVGSPAPSYSAQRLDGTPIALDSLRGQVVLLNIWATWCKPCREEIPALESLHRQHASAGLVIAGVSIDQSGDTTKIRQYAQDLGASYPIWHDADDRVSSTFLAIGVPSSYLIDREGILRWRHVGPVKADDPALTAALTEALRR